MGAPRCATVFRGGGLSPVVEDRENILRHASFHVWRRLLNQGQGSLAGGHVTCEVTMGCGFMPRATDFVPAIARGPVPSRGKTILDRGSRRTGK